MAKAQTPVSPFHPDTPKPVLYHKGPLCMSKEQAKLQAPEGWTAEWEFIGVQVVTFMTSIEFELDDQCPYDKFQLRSEVVEHGHKRLGTQYRGVWIEVR
jgi:hypothetical protein